MKENSLNKMVLGSISNGSRPSSEEFARSSHACVISWFQALWFPPTVQRHAPYLNWLP